VFIYNTICPQWWWTWPS